MLSAGRDCGFAPARVLEPTCGSGVFLQAAAAAYPAAVELYGLEYQSERYASAHDQIRRQQPRVRIVHGDAYATDFGALPWRAQGRLLIVGNPPWLTAAALGRGALAAVSGEALLTVPQPPRENLTGLRGLAARTGAANFDVAEFLIVKLLRDLRHEALDMAFLIKESVARKALQTAIQLELGVIRAHIVRIDARRWFGVAVDACCLLLSTSPGRCLDAPVPIQPSFDALPCGTFVPLRPAARRPPPAILFRQGIKHDAADVFELRAAGAGWRNGFGDRIDVEPDFIYPLRKAGALHAGRIEPTALIVTQTRLGASTAELAATAPRLWRYLRRHAERIAARKSSIYRSAPEFAMFGVGPYSFAAWKVAIAGMYAEACFRLIEPHAGRPVMLGDTAYFASFRDEVDARAFLSLCTSRALNAEIAARVVRGKRPITKALLDSLDWNAHAALLEPFPDRLRALLCEAAAG